VADLTATAAVIAARHIEPRRSFALANLAGAYSLSGGAATSARSQ
jgi:hypothetical protein